MKLKTIVAGTLTALGIAALAYHDMTYTAVASSAGENTHGIRIPPILGAIALVGGMALQLTDRVPSSPRSSRTLSRAPGSFLPVSFSMLRGRRGPPTPARPSPSPTGSGATTVASRGNSSLGMRQGNPHFDPRAGATR